MACLPPRSEDVDADKNSMRPRWRKKRWRIAVAAWLLLPVLADLSHGPAMYCYRRGWVSGDFGHWVYYPIARFWWHMPDAIRMPRHEFVWWWNELGKKHAAEARETVTP